MMNDWNPMTHLYEEPTPQCLLRIKKDIAEFNAQPPPRLFISPEESDVTQVHVLMLGAPGSPYEGGFFQFFLKFPPNYPLSPPVFDSLTRTEVCVTTLGTAGGLCDWSPAQSLSSMLISIQSLVGDNVHDLARVQYETIRVAVCDQVDAALKEDATLPPAFRKIILESFLESYGKYEDAVMSRLQTGWKLDAMFGAAKPAEYEKLLTRLQSLKHKVEERKEAEAASAVAAAQAAAENQNY